ncbi:MAG TPA: flagellar basal body rod protein FlgB [Pseudolabrys sp.]|nr:flagellar basal body rod protein FlgB [Pseudolabrys sp.]
MSIGDIPILGMLRTRMEWHQQRQKVLSENVANSDTPQFKPRDLVEPKFDSTAVGSLPQIALARTEGGHIGAASSSSLFKSTADGKYDVRPTGNAVSLEDEMIKVAGNQMDYQSATAIYTKSLGLLKIALGKK